MGTAGIEISIDVCISLYLPPPLTGTRSTQDAFLGVNIPGSVVQEKGASCLKTPILCLLEPWGSECTLWKITFPGRVVTVIIGDILQVAMPCLFLFDHKTS